MNQIEGVYHEVIEKSERLKARFAWARGVLVIKVTDLKTHLA